MLRGLGETAREKECNALYHRTPVQSPATTDFIQREDADESSKLRIISLDVNFKGVR